MIKNKVLSIILAAALVFCMLPAEVFATAGTVFEVSDSAGLSAAVTNAASGDTIRLLANIDYSGGIVITDKSIVFDLNEHTLSITNASGHGLEVGSGGYVGITGSGALNASSSADGSSDDIGGVYAHNGGQATVTSASAAGYCAWGALAEDGGIIHVTGNSSSSGEYGTAAGVLSLGSIHITGNAVSTGAGSTGAYSCGGSVEVGGSASGVSYGAFAYGSASVVSVNGNVTGNTGAGAYSLGTVNIDGTITATNYIDLGGTIKTASQGTQGSGEYICYQVYTDGSNIVRVKLPAVCEIGSFQYPALNNAIDASVDGDTIRLLTDIDYNTGILVEGKAITFDLNGYTLNVSNSAGPGLEVGMDGAVDIVDITGDGALNASSSGGVYCYGVYAYNYGYAKVTSASSAASGGIGAYASLGGAIVVTGDATANSEGGVGAFAYYGGIISIGGDAEGYAYGAEAAMSSSVLEVAGDARCTGGSGDAVHVEYDGSITVHGNVGGNALCGVYMFYSGTAIVGGSVTATDTGVCLYNGGTATVDGTVSAPTYMQLQGVGKIVSEGSAGAPPYENYLVYSDENSNTARVKITGAYFETAGVSFDKNGTDDAQAAIVWNSAWEVTDVKKGGASIGTGNFSAAGNTLTIEKEYLATLPYGDAVFSVEFNHGDPAELTVNIGDSRAVCRIGSLIYLNLGDALTEVYTGQTITLLADIEYSGGISIDSKTITFDLNTHTLGVTNDLDDALKVGAGGHVDITGDGAFNVTSNQLGSSGVYAHDGGQATVTNATSTTASGAGVYVSGGSRVDVTGSVTGNFGAFSGGSGSEVFIGVDAAGGLYGARAESGGHIAVGGDATASSLGGSGAYAIDTDSSIEVIGSAGGNSSGAYADNGGVVTIGVNASGGAYGAYAGLSSTISVTGDATANSPGSIGAFAYYGGHVTVGSDAQGYSCGAEASMDGSVMEVMGDVSCTGGGDTAVYVESNGSVTVHGNVGGNALCGVYIMYGGTAVVGGSVTAADTGVYSYNGGDATIDGTVSAPVTYIQLQGVVKAASEGVRGAPPYEDYLVYSDGNGNTVRVLADCEMDGTLYATLDPASQGALCYVNPGDTKTIKLLKDIGYNTGILVEGKSIFFDLNGHTLGVTNSAGYGLEVGSGGTVDITGGGAFNVASSKDSGSGIYYAGVYAHDGGKAKVTNATFTGNGGRGACATGAGSYIEVTGDSIATGTNCCGALASNDGEIIVGGGISVSGDGSTGLDSTGTGSSIQVAGDVIVEGANCCGVWSSSGAIATIGGGVTSTGNSSFSVCVVSGGTAHVGSVNASGDSSYGAYASGLGSQVEVAGDLSSAGNNNSYGVRAVSGGEVSVGGSINANGGSIVAAMTNDAGSSIEVTGGVNSQGAGCYGVWAYGGEITVDGSVASAGMGACASEGGVTRVGGSVSAISDGGRAASSDGSGSLVHVTGDVASDGAGSFGAFAINGGMVEVGRDAVSTGNTGRGVYATNGAVIVVGRNVSASGDYSNGVLATWNNSTVSVAGSVTAAGTGSTGVSVNQGTATIEGTISIPEGGVYIALQLIPKTFSDGVQGSGQYLNYLIYTDGNNNTVRVHNPGYIVTFDPQGGRVSPSSITVSNLQAYSLPTPTRSYYYFFGWYEGRNGTGDLIETGDPVVLTGNITLYARWVPNSLVALSAPSLTAKADGYNAVMLTWKAVKGAEGYEIWKKESGVYTCKETVGAGTLYYRDTNVNKGAYYYYQVRAYHTPYQAKVYSYSSYRYAKPVWLAVSLKAAPESYNSIKLTWNRVPGASGYEIYRAASYAGPFDTPTYTVPQGADPIISYTDDNEDTGLAPGTYYYRVKAYASSTEFSLSAVRYARPAWQTIKLTAASESYNSIKLTWNRIPGAEGYEVFRASSYRGPFDTAIDTVPQETDTIITYSDDNNEAGLAKGTVYYYEVRAYNGTEKSANSSYRYARPVWPTVRLTAVSDNYDSIMLTWNEIEKPEGVLYTVLRYDPASGDYIELADPDSKGMTDTFYRDESLTLGKTYYYRVKAYVSADEYTISSSRYARPAWQKINFTAAAKSINSIELTWNETDGVAGYEIYRAESYRGPFTTSIDTVLKGTGDTATYTDNKGGEGLVTGKTYYYKIRSYYLSGTDRVYSPYFGYKYAKPAPPAPEEVTLERASAVSIDVSWTASAGATGYEVWRSTSLNGSYSLAASTTTELNCENTGLYVSRTYYYKVRAYIKVGSVKVYGAFSEKAYLIE